MQQMVEHLLSIGALKMKRNQAELVLEFFNLARFNGRKQASLPRLMQEQIVEAIHCLNQHSHYVRQPITIDDRALTFRGDYDSILTDIDNFKPYWHEYQKHLEIGGQSNA